MEKEIPRRPETLSYQYEKSGDSLILRKKEPLGVVIFLTVWLTGWTVGCVILTWSVLAKPTFFDFCFVGAFWAGWLAGFGVLIGSLFGRKTAWLNRDGLSSEYRVLFWTASRYAPLEEIRCFHAKTEKAKDSDSSDSYSVETAGSGKPISFSATNFEEAQWVAYEMNRMLEVLKREPVPDVVEEAENVEKPVVIAWNSRPREVERPSDCRWWMNAEVDSAVFERRGASLMDVAVSTVVSFLLMGFCVLFGMAVCGLLSGMDRVDFSAGMVYWIVPGGLALVAAVMLLFAFVAWFTTLFSPFERTRWSFSQGGATCRVAWFGIGRNWYYSLEGCREMVIEVQPLEWRRLKQRYRMEEEKYRIVFAGAEDMCVIRDLTKDEAKWIADNILWYR